MKATSASTESRLKLQKRCSAIPIRLSSKKYFIEDQGEQRQTILGMTERLALIIVILVDHDSAAGDTIHLISARKADKYEQTIYSSSFQS